MRGGDWFRGFCTLRENEPNRVNKLHQQTIWSKVQLVGDHEYVSSHISIGLEISVSVLVLRYQKKGLLENRDNKKNKKIDSVGRENKMEAIEDL